MKLIIQIPCFNEEKTLPITIKDLPKKLAGIDVIEYLIIDDGSTDNTVKLARSLNVHHIIKIQKNKGLANAFTTGINESLKRGADIIVNTDGDNQYCGKDIKKLISPILSNNAEIVIGNRQINNIKEFSSTKKIFQKLGCFIVRLVSNTNVIDAPCGFRAYSREAALKINITNKYTYTLESIICSGLNKEKIVNVNIRTNGKLRESRLFSNIWIYITLSAFTIIKLFILNKPNIALLIPGLLNIILGITLLLIYNKIKIFLFLIFIGMQFIFMFFILNSLLTTKKINNQILYLSKKNEFEK